MWSREQGFTRNLTPRFVSNYLYVASSPVFLALCRTGFGRGEGFPPAIVRRCSRVVVYAPSRPRGPVWMNYVETKHRAFDLLVRRSAGDRISALIPSLPQSITMFRGLSIRTRLLTPRPPPCRYSGTAPKRPSPYRLLSPISFLSSFAPLHVSGWRLVPLPSFTSIQNVGSDTGDLQDRRIVRVLGFDEYDDALKFICGLGDIIRAQDVSFATSFQADR